jgi:hypothetical protein
MNYRATLLKILLLGLITTPTFVEDTNAYFTNLSTLQSNTVTTGCWVDPSVPQLISPANNFVAGTSSSWNIDPKMVWVASSTECPLSTAIVYKYQSFRDASLNQLAFESGWLTETFIPAPNTPEGDYWWKVQACDSLGNCSEWSEAWKLTVDRTKPVVEVTEPEDGDMVSGDVLIKGSVSDDNPEAYWFKITDANGQNIYESGEKDMSASFTDYDLYTWDTSSLTNGDYYVILKARDEGGNESSEDKIKVFVNNDRSYQIGDVLINEIMWMGSTDKSSDEWIELRNMTDEEIDLSGWVVVGLEETDHPLPLSGLLPSKNDQATNGYFLISSQAYDDNNSGLNVKQDLLVPALNLSNKAEQLILKDSHGNIVDRTSAATTPPSDWAAGSFDNGKEAFSKSMQRKEGTATAGHNAGSWGDCTHDVCNDGKYWDNSDGPDYGTPKDENKFAVLTVSSSSLKLDNGPKTSGLKIPDDLQLNSLSAVTPTPTPTPTVTPSVQDTELVEEIKGDGGSETTDDPQVTPTPTPTSSEQEINDENTNAINESATILNTTQTLKAPDETDSDIEVEPVEEEPTKEEEGGGDVPEEEPAIKEEEYEEEASEDSEDSGGDGDGESDEDSGTEENDDEPEEPSSESEGLE